MASILILYGTRYGHTAKLAAVIASVIRVYDYHVDVIRADQLPPDFSLEPYDAVIIGGSVINTQHQSYVRRFVRRNRTLLGQKTTAFFSVSAAAASTRPRDREDAQRFAQRFLDQTDWQPAQVGIFAGAVSYSRYGRLTRWLMQGFMWRQGGDTDASRDYEYTNWAAVRTFTEHVLALLHPHSSGA